MDASEAREHLEMVERIVSASSRKLEASGELFLAWGLASGTFDLLLQLASDGRIPAASLWAVPVILVAAVLYTIARVRAYRASGEGRMSLLEREFLNVLWIALCIAFAVNVIGGHIFAQWAQSAIWSVVAAIVLFYIGVHGNRRALAAGMYLGYAGFGLADLLAHE